MKKFLLLTVLACAASAVAQDAQQASSSQGSSQQGSSASGPVIKDPAEYNAYMTAQTMTDNNQKASALEGFVQQYPNSVVKEDALAGAMAAYQAAGNQQKMMDTAQRLLEVNPNNVLGLFVRVYGLGQQQGEQAAKDAGALAQRALPLLQGRKKPDGMTDQQFADQNKAFAGVFNGAIGKAALTSKDYPTAIQAFQAAMTANPSDPNNVYFLGSAYLASAQPTDQDRLAGIWYMARTIAMVPNWDVPVKLVKYHYKKYHGSEEGLDQLLAQAKSATTSAMPAGFGQNITKFVPPSPKETAAKMLQECAPEKMDFGQWIYILTSGNDQAANTVWTALQNKALRFQGWVLETGKDKVGMAVTEDGHQANKVEVMVTMLDPMKTAPAVGSEFKVQAVPTTYTADPFVINMEQGVNLDTPAAGTKGKAKAAPKKAPAKRSTKKR
jgi:tetratricopeptide (TPR) repeat protein